MSHKNNKKQSFLKTLLNDTFESFMEGYYKGRDFKEKEDKNNIVILDDASVHSVLDKMQQADIQLLITKINSLETHIKLLQDQIKVFVYNEKQSQELIVNLMTTVEEMLHSMEEAGIIPVNEMSTLPSFEEAQKQQASRMNDVMRTDGNISNDLIINNSKKYDLN